VVKEYDQGLYSNLPSTYTQEELKTMYRLKGAGRRVKYPVLEEKLVKYYNELNKNFTQSLLSCWHMNALRMMRNF